MQAKKHQGRRKTSAAILFSALVALGFMLPAFLSESEHLLSLANGSFRLPKSTAGRVKETTQLCDAGNLRAGLSGYEISENPKLSLSESKIEKTIYVMATAYSSTPDQTDDNPFITATGSYVRDGIIAANFLKFGTLVRFPEHYGNKVFSVDDRMNQRFYRRVDIWMPTRQEAREFGAKVLKMEIIRDAD